MQVFALVDEPDHDGAEVFSLIRRSTLSPDEYCTRFFDTGREHQEELRPGAADPGGGFPAGEEDPQG